jgi:hypothetical protein
MRNIDEAATSGAMYPALGFWTAMLLVALSAAYVGILGWTALQGSAYPPPEPFQTAIHLIVLLTVPALVFFWAMVHDAATEDRKIFSLTALAFMIIFAALVAINRFVALTVVPQSLALGATSGLQWFMPYEWPSVMLAIELLGWGFFFGAACLSLAPVFQSSKLELAICITLVITAVLNFTSVIGLVTNQFGILGMVAPLAWGVGPISAFILMGVWFHHQA